MKYVLLFATVLAGLYLLGEQEPDVVLDVQSIYVIDGDTIDIDGARYRLSGFDTPETYRSLCPSELDLGNRATERLKQIINDASVIELRPAGAHDQYGRGIARLFVGDRDVGDILIEEGLARRYTGGPRRSWC